MRRVAAVLLLATLGLVTGCDPGFTVRQVLGRSQRHPGVPEAPQRVSVEVTKFHVFIGSGHYDPTLRIKNTTELPVEVNGFQLVTSRGTYESSSRESDLYPVSVSPGATKEIEVWFDLREGVGTTFKRPAELRVHYAIGNASETASARLVGKVESASEP